MSLTREHGYHVMTSKAQPKNSFALTKYPVLRIDIQSIFSKSPKPTRDFVINSSSFTRENILKDDVANILQDRFPSSDASSCFLRIPADQIGHTTLALQGEHHITTCAAGGWLITPRDTEQDSFWIPKSPHLRKLDHDKHILAHQVPNTGDVVISNSQLAITFEIPSTYSLDVVIWRFPCTEIDLIQSLQECLSLEQQRYFLWSSHTTYTCAADLYLHLIHGLVYENHEVWPKYWRVCSELDAYALYVTLNGLHLATGKRLYGLLKTQLVFSVIARQADDGGWYHGEWTDQMESHYRLHAGAMHLLTAYLETNHDPVVSTALEKAAAFAAKNIDQLHIGTWYLHDSLEQRKESIEEYPFRILPSRVLGKTDTNLLVLNTHLDTNIAIERYSRVTGDKRYEALIRSANAATEAILNLRPAEWLYRPLFRAIALTFLPAAQAKSLSIPKRAIKRIAWKYLIPQLPRIKKIFPRLVMPQGYIERELTMFAFSVRYQPVNLMDLIRTRLLFSNTALDKLLIEGFEFTQKSGIKARWKGLAGKEDDSLGFWAEALYTLCLAKSDFTYRSWLAEAMLDLEDNGLGLPPSLLGSNAEAIAIEDQRPCPIPVSTKLRVASLNRGAVLELIIVNPTEHGISLEWIDSPPKTVRWKSADGTDLSNASAPFTIPPRSWLFGLHQDATI